MSQENKNAKFETHESKSFGFVFSQKNDSLESIELMKSLCSQILNFMTETSQNIPKNDQKKLKNCEKVSEEIEKICDKNAQDISNLRKVIQNSLSPDEKNWKSWNCDELFKY